MRKEQRMRVAAIGAGTFAEANMYPTLSLHFFDDTDRLAICDISSDRATRLASKYGWPATYTDYREMIEKEKPDAVFVCVGARHHPDIVTEVLDMGLPVFLEKPAAIDAAGTDRIMEAAERNSLPVQVGHQKRYGLAYARAREIVGNTGDFGNIIQIESKMHGFTVFPTFYTCMLEWQCHNLDLVISFGGAISGIEARAKRIEPNTGTLTALLTFENGALGTLAWGTFGGPGRFVERVEILSDRGKGVIITNGREVTRYDGDVGETWAPDWNPISRNQSHVFNGYAGEYRAFLDNLMEGKPPVPSIQDESVTMHNLEEIARKAGIPVEWGPVASAL